MREAMRGLVDRLGAKRLVALALGPGILAIGLDSAIAHFAGKTMSHAGQIVPLAYGAAACVFLVVVAMPAISRKTFRLGMRVVAVTAAIVGIAGTVFHLVPMIEDLQDEELSAAAIEGALGLAPPLFAPLAFVAFGMILWIVASPRVSIEVHLEQVKEIEPLKAGALRSAHTFRR